MEQQTDDWETLSFLDQTAKVKFFRGCYSCDGVKGSYSTLENLKEAWVKKLKEDKKRELHRLALALKRTKRKTGGRISYGSKRNYLKREQERWQITKLGR
jgi:hypothetical protein